ncbi:helix-turn-helix transcriptional regulator [Hamadaea sp. NPDC050747]|uniref:helix-turn-helix domain-containing protein n=1 Tax=Hamadaea sp. NPDC050747 TaxID=3155789 RepID=UPI0033F6A2DB
MSRLNPHESARHFFGAELRHRRLAAGFSQAALASRVIMAASSLNKVELALRFPSADLAARCDDVLGAEGALVRLHKFVMAERARADEPLNEPVVLSGPEARALRRLLAGDAAEDPAPSRGLMTDVFDRMDFALETASPSMLSMERRMQ